MATASRVARIHESLLAPAERILLRWLARHMPAKVTPDGLTVTGLAGAALAGIGYTASAADTSWLWLASLGLALNWFGDSLDGTLARLRRIERPAYGFFIDHSCDVISQVFIFMGLGASPFMRFDVACLTVMAYWLAALYTFIRAVATGIFQISYWGVGPTEIRLALIGYNLALLAGADFRWQTRIGQVTPMDVACVLIFLLVFASFLAMVWSEGRRLAADETQH